MPITAKLSRQFYEKLGDEVTNELVTWLNAVDDSYRQEFKELFAAHFGKLHAEMGQLEARIDSKLEKLKSELLIWMFVFWVGTMGTVLAIVKL
jgi:hypothetical protein